MTLAPEFDIQQCLDALRVLTLKAVHNIDAMTENDFTAFIEEREQLILKLNPVQSDLLDSHKHQIRDILNYDHVILARMEILKKEAEDSLNRLQVGKIQRNAYHQSYSADSLFFDQRK
ncbi:hypothetical protein [Paenibacillus hubeiensis]|uniref:hypothetical protein n=1 Tax=Paenibacillus hubeiensis TaxID=3077330 RepID=UPI0031BAC6E7